MKANTVSNNILNVFQCEGTGETVLPWNLKVLSYLQYDSFKVSSLSDLELKLLLGRFSELRENFSQIQGSSLGFGSVVRPCWPASSLDSGNTMYVCDLSMEGG